MSKTKRFLSLMLTLVMVLGMIPTMAFAAETPIFSVTDIAIVNNGTNFHAWTVSAGGGTSRYSGTIGIKVSNLFYNTGYNDYAAGEGSTGVYGYDFVNSSGTAGFTVAKTSQGNNNSTAYITGTVEVTEKTPAEIAAFFNDSLRVNVTGLTSYGNNGCKLEITSVDTNEYNPTYTVTVVRGGTDELATADNTGSGTVTVNGQAVSFGSSVAVPQGSQVTVVFTPDSADNSYLTAYSAGGESADEQNITTATTVTFTPTSNVTVSALFLKKITLNDPRPDDYTNRTAGALVWSQTIGSSISYKDAVADDGGINFNARVNTYLLNSYFGTSIYYGDQSLPNPAVYMYLTMSDGTNVKVGEPNAFQPLDRDAIGGKSPSRNGIDLAVSLEKEKIVPGDVSQAVYADYTTANAICGNHWYHVYGVNTYASKLEREFTIEKDVLGFYNGSIANALGDSFTFDSDGNVAGFDPQLLPASFGENASQARLGYTSQKNYVIYDSNGTPVADNKITKSGTYTVKNKAFAETDYIKAYAADAISHTFTVSKGTNPVTVKTPVVKSLTAGSVTVDTESIVAGQLYSIDGGQTWISGTELKNNGGVFGNLAENTSYTVTTKLPETDMFLEQSASAAPVTTYVKVKGAIKLAEGDSLSAPLLTEGTVVTFTAADGTSFNTTVAADGTYSIDLPAGNYSVTSTSKDGEQSGTISNYTVANNDPDNPETVTDIIVKDTDKGIAKKFLAANLTDEDGKLVNTVTADTIAQILAAEEEAGGLSQSIINELDSLLGYQKDGQTSTFAQMIADAKTLKTEIELAEAKKGAADDIDVAMGEYLALVEAQEHLTDEEKEAFADRIRTAKSQALQSLGNTGVENFEEVIKGIVENAAAAMSDAADDAVAADFVKAYVTGEEGIYSQINSENADQILSGAETWETMTESQREKADALIAAANSSIEGAPQSYEAFTQGLEAFAETSATDFIETYLTGEDGEIYKEANGENYQDILAGKSDWDNMSKMEQDAVNAKLIAAGSKSYPELLAMAESIEAAANDFIEEYLTDKKGNIYKEATKDNYAQILSGKDAWDELTEAEQDAINAILTANGGKTYEELLEQAEKLKKEYGPKTGDESNGILWITLFAVSAFGAVLVLLPKFKKEKYQR